MSERWLHCVFCEDIRQEIGNKFSLMGIMMGDMIVGDTEFPILFHQFVTQIWITTPRDEPMTLVTVEILGPAGEEMARVSQEILPDNYENRGNVEKITFGFSAVQSPFQMPKEGVIEAWVTIDGERQKAGQIGIWRSPPAPPMA